MFEAIPFGQPILVGHYSEQRDRNYRGRADGKMRKGVELHEKAGELRSRAEAMANNRSIFTDDPSASEKLQDRIDQLEKRQELMKTANKLLLKGDREGLFDLGFDEKIFKPDVMGCIGFPRYALSNNSANIRRLKQRLEKIKEQANDTTREFMINGVRVVDNVEDNRLQLFFPGKPDAETRSKLKSNGFRWSPSVGAWQRYRSKQANWATGFLLGVSRQNKYYNNTGG